MRNFCLLVLFALVLLFAWFVVADPLKTGVLVVIPEVGGTQTVVNFQAIKDVVEENGKVYVLLYAEDKDGAETTIRVETSVSAEEMRNRVTRARKYLENERAKRRAKHLLPEID